MILKPKKNTLACSINKSRTEWERCAAERSVLKTL